MFTYRYQHGVDGQGRIQFPSRWKLRASDSELVAVVVTHRLLKKDYVLVLPYDLFESFTERLRTAAFTDMTAQASRHEYAERMMTIDLAATKSCVRLPVDEDPGVWKCQSEEDKDCFKFGGYTSGGVPELMVINAPVDQATVREIQ